MLEYYDRLKPDDPALASAKTFRLLLSSGGFLSTAAARRALPKIEAFLQIRMTIKSVIDRGEDYGGVWSTCLEVAPYDFHTVEASMTRHEKQAYAATSSVWVPLFYRIRRDENDDDKDDQEEAPVSLRAKGSYSLTAMRRLAMSTFAPFSEHISVWSNDTEANRAAREKRLERAFPKGGDNGLQWLIGILLEDQHLPPGAVTNPAPIAVYLAAQSPKLRVIAAALAAHIGRGEQVLILCEHPATQWLVEMFICLVGLSVASIRQDTPQRRSHGTFGLFEQPELFKV
ncbi:hypothetical protein IWX90DRAFT_413400 [Phyllosticta citrichinensis]|uniref:Uncharacterized protein n=1 Tax=Phyllosticta citrichinensis TaxID=1130410 RepID=A0ABR1Y0A2_9PEZI